MFIGAIDDEFRRWLGTNAEQFKGRRIFVGCSGNFTIEQIIGEGAAEVHSNDVSIYSWYLGRHLSGEANDWRILKPEWEWLKPYLERNAGAVAVQLFELLRWPPEKNAHNRRLYRQRVQNWDAEFEKTCERVEGAKAKARLTRYTAMDVWDFVDHARATDPDGIIFAFLPFYKNDYEKLYRAMGGILSYEEPRYKIIDRERKNALFAKVAANGSPYVFIDDYEHRDYPLVMWKRRSRTKDVFLHSNLDTLRVFTMKHTSEKPTHYPLITDEDLDRITPASKVVIKRVKGPEINYFKNRFMKKTIIFTDGSWNFLFFVDGKLFGFAVATLSKYGDGGIYILSDFVVPLAKENRLAKLLLFMLQTKHFREHLEEILLSPVGSLYTTAFTDKPVSMKYRGAWELAKRGENPDGTKFLNYETRTGIFETDREAIEKWLKRKK